MHAASDWPDPELARALQKEAEAVLKRLWPKVKRELRGHDPMVQGAVLADLAAIWLRGFIAVGDPAETARMQQEMWEAYAKTVQSLVHLVYTNPPQGEA